jgi:ubiquinone/menaquinone biosynthesis C-methylase UbiE
MTSRPKWTIGASIGLTTVAAITIAARASKNSLRETQRLAEALEWKPGRNIAEVGAGAGKMTMAAARALEPGGRMYATEVDPMSLRQIRKRAAKHRLANITVIESSQFDSRLPADCCDAIFMRGVYHHFTDPAAMDASFLRALHPGGLIAIDDFPPSRLLSFFVPVKGVPANRGGHGVPRQVVVHELTAAGFEFVKELERWPGQGYCLVFRKPAPTS